MMIKIDAVSLDRAPRMTPYTGAITFWSFDIDSTLLLPGWDPIVLRRVPLVEMFRMLAVAVTKAEQLGNSEWVVGEDARKFRLAVQGDSLIWRVPNSHLVSCCSKREFARELKTAWVRCHQMIVEAHPALAGDPTAGVPMFA